MSAILIIAAAVVLLAIGYVTYGSWLAKQWGIDPARKTPAVEMEDGVDYVAAKPVVLMGHHLSNQVQQERSSKTHNSCAEWKLRTLRDLALINARSRFSVAEAARERFLPLG